MKLANFVPKSIFKKGLKKAVIVSSDVVAKSPEAASLSETVIKRATSLIYIGDKAAHFHLVIFGIILGCTFMTSIIAIGKLAVALELRFVVENRDLVPIFGYAAFFIGIADGFFRHYKSKHHLRFISLEKAALDAEFDLKRQTLEHMHQERTEYLGKKIAEAEQTLEILKKKMAVPAVNPSKWDAITSINPLNFRGKVK